MNMKRHILITGLLLSCFTLAAWAHEGMIHVMGIVTKLSHDSVTVQTTDKKSVDVALADTTTYEKDKKAKRQRLARTLKSAIV